MSRRSLLLNVDILSNNVWSVEVLGLPTASAQLPILFAKPHTPSPKLPPSRPQIFSLSQFWPWIDSPAGCCKLIFLLKRRFFCSFIQQVCLHRWGKVMPNWRGCVGGTRVEPRLVRIGTTGSGWYGIGKTRPWIGTRIRARQGKMCGLSCWEECEKAGLGFSVPQILGQILCRKHYCSHCY